jgi:hypothetical protein
MMITTNQNHVKGINQYTKQAVRAFWLDGLWELAFVGVLLMIGFWGMFYVQFVAYPISTWPFLQEMGSNIVWSGLLILTAALALYIWIAWIIVKRLKRIFIAPYTGHVEHPFFLPIDSKVFLWYFILYLLGHGLLYGLFSLSKGGLAMMSVPLIIAPAAIFWGIGRVYGIQRYQWLAPAGLILAILLELLLITPSDYTLGPKNFLDVLPRLGSPALPSFVWAVMLTISGLVGFINVRKSQHES